MVSFFFYNKLTNIELLKKINNNFKIYDGFIIIEKYDRENNVLEISNEPNNNNKLLYGKIVDFNISLNDIIKKINEMIECRTKNKINYKLDLIWTNKTFGGTCKTYIIY